MSRLLLCNYFRSYFSSDEFKGHLLLEAVVSGDMTKVRKLVTAKLVLFQHPLTLDTSLVSLPV